MKDRVIWIICILAFILGVAYSRHHSDSMKNLPSAPEAAHMQ